MANETFTPAGAHPDFSAPDNWSGGTVPGAGTVAVINVADAYVDPQTSLGADIVLTGGADLIGNGGGFLLTADGTIQAQDSNALYANGAIVNQGVIAVGSAATLTVVVQAGENVAAFYGLSEPSFENAGTLNDRGVLEIEGTEFSNIGTVLVAGGVLDVTGGWVDGGQGSLAPGGEIDISKGGYAGFGDGVVDQVFDFLGPGTLSFADPGDVQAVAVADFGYRDEILTGSVAQARELLKHGLTFTTAPPAGMVLAVEKTASGAAIVLETAPCFARGSGILTPGGYVPVEALAPGDLVVTDSGVAATVRWVGRRTIDLATHARPEAVRPIHVNPGAIGTGRPARRVTLSPDHALFLHGQLVPVKLLVNGATILRDQDCLAVTYFHVELDRHEIMVVENLAVESYLDTGNRAMFERAAGAPRASPVFGRGRQWNSRAVADLCLTGLVLRRCREEIYHRTLALGFLQKLLPDVYLTLDGKRINRGFGVTSLPCFRLPEIHGGLLGIRSATFVPAEMSSSSEAEDDYRRLGVAIRRVRLDLTSHAARDIARAGFHPRGQGDIADWTDGNGIIAVPPTTTIVGLNITALPRAWQQPVGMVTRDQEASASF